jgi:hypothetical protein
MLRQIISVGKRFESGCWAPLNTNTFNLGDFEVGSEVILDLVGGWGSWARVLDPHFAELVDLLLVPWPIFLLLPLSPVYSEFNNQKSII